MHFTVKGRGSFKIMLSKRLNKVQMLKKTSETSTGWLAKIFGLVKAVKKNELWFQKKNDKEDLKFQSREWTKVGEREVQAMMRAFPPPRGINI